MSQRFVVAGFCLHHNPFLMRVEVRLFRPRKENIDLGWLLLHSLYWPGSHDTNDALTSKAVICWRKSNDGSGDQAP